MSSFGDLAAALLEEAALALRVNRAVTGSMRSEEGEQRQGPLRTVLLRIVAASLVLAAAVWLVAGLSSDESVRSRFVVAGYAFLAVSLAALFGWAASFGVVRSRRRKS